MNTSGYYEQRYEGIPELSFKELTEEDLPFLNALRNECAEEFLHDSRTFTVEQTEQWFKTLKIPYYLVYYGSEKAGYFRLNLKEGSLYIGMDLIKELRGKGIGYEAYKLFLPFVFDKFGVEQVRLDVLETNTSAYNLYLKLGFKDDPEKETKVVKNGQDVRSINMFLNKESVH